MAFFCLTNMTVLLLRHQCSLPQSFIDSLGVALKPQHVLRNIVQASFEYLSVNRIAEMQ